MWKTADRRTANNEEWAGGACSFPMMFGCDCDVCIIILRVPVISVEQRLFRTRDTCATSFFSRSQSSANFQLWSEYLYQKWTSYSYSAEFLRIEANENRKQVIRLSSIGTRIGRGLSHDNLKRVHGRCRYS
ncbi:hypothetical protein BDZ91DRAFT_269205 [Kalaharituber pfeilii]|nr:hypothetical protein BDZ91DRAFT_269205 [Kalaharituber pfeilii]